MIRTTIVLALLGIASYVAYVVVSSYLASTGTVWERLLAASQNSATILWSKLVAAIGALVAGLDFVADYLDAPDVKSTLQGMVNPKYVGGFVLAVALITIAARMRSLKS